jgi:ubiquinone/menaquinone biosynthesis C-methylase UbiE
MNSRQMRLENPARLQELRPEETLKRIGLQENDVLCDTGAGSGVFTIPAAKMTRNTVLALEIEEELLALIAEKAQSEGLRNVELLKVSGNHLPVTDSSVDIVLLVTVLHEIADPAVFLEEVKRLLRNGGKLALIEFHKRQTPMGPPLAQRLGREEAKELLGQTGFTVREEFDLGDNFYCLVFGKGEAKGREN